MLHDIPTFIKEYMRTHHLSKRAFGTRLVKRKDGRMRLTVNSKEPIIKFLNQNKDHSIRLSSMVTALSKINLELYVVQVSVDLSSLRRKNDSGLHIKEREEVRYPWVRAFHNSVKFNHLSCLKIAKKSGYDQRQIEHMLLGVRNNNYRVVKEVLETVGLMFQIREIVPNANTSGREKNGKGVQPRHGTPNENNVLQANG